MFELLTWTLEKYKILVDNSTNELWSWGKTYKNIEFYSWTPFFIFEMNKNQMAMHDLVPAIFYCRESTCVNLNSKPKYFTVYFCWRPIFWCSCSAKEFDGNKHFVTFFKSFFKSFFQFELRSAICLGFICNKFIIAFVPFLNYSFVRW